MSDVDVAALLDTLLCVLIMYNAWRVYVWLSKED